MYIPGHRRLGSGLHPRRNVVRASVVPWTRLQPPTGSHPRRHRHAYSGRVLRHHLPPLSRLHPIVAHPQAATVHRAVSSRLGRGDRFPQQDFGKLHARSIAPALTPTPFLSDLRPEKAIDGRGSAWASISLIICVYPFDSSRRRALKFLPYIESMTLTTSQPHYF